MNSRGGRKGAGTKSLVLLLPALLLLVIAAGTAGAGETRYYHGAANQGWVYNNGTNRMLTGGRVWTGAPYTSTGVMSKYVPGGAQIMATGGTSVTLSHGAYYSKSFCWISQSLDGWAPLDCYYRT